MADDSDDDYSLSDSDDGQLAPSARAQAKEASEKAAARFSCMLKTMIQATRPKPSKTRCKRDLATLDLELTPPQPSGKRQRKSVAHFEAGSAQCFVRTKVTPPASLDEHQLQPASVSPPVSSPVPWVRTDRERDRKKAVKCSKPCSLRKSDRAKKRADKIAAMVGKLGDHDELSWRQRRNLAIKAWLGALQCGYGKLIAYHVASFACGASERVVQAWVARWSQDAEGFEASYSWGGHSSPSILMEEDVMAASRTWWREHAPKKGASSRLVHSHLFVAGRVRVRIADFHTFLCGTEEQPGFLRSSDLPYEKKDFSEERLRQYAHFLGFAFDDTGTGAFNDAHESEDNRKDRHERFLPGYFDFFSRGISTFTHKGIVFDVDTRLEDEEGNDLTEARRTMVTIEDLDGNVFDIDMGGNIPEGDGPVPLLISHDEACFGAGEFESKVNLLLVLISSFPLAGLARESERQEDMQRQDNGTEVAHLRLRRGIRQWGNLSEARSRASSTHSFESI